jgi:hypothetical protein
MKRLAMTIALSCALSVSALATDGDIPSGGFNAPPPDETSTPTAPVDIPSVVLTQEITETALTLIQLALSGVL